MTEKSDNFASLAFNDESFKDGIIEIAHGIWQNIAALSVLRCVASNPFTEHESILRMLYVTRKEWDSKVVTSSIVIWLHHNKWHKLGFGAVWYSVPESR